MITIFNRQEFLITFDIKRQAEVRSLLAQNNIDYSVKTVNRKSPSPFSANTRDITGTFGENLQLECEYVIYVKKSDYDRASAILHSKRNSVSD